MRAATCAVEGEVVRAGAGVFGDHGLQQGGGVCRVQHCVVTSHCRGQCEGSSRVRACSHRCMSVVHCMLSRDSHCMNCMMSQDWCMSCMVCWDRYRSCMSCMMCGDS